MLFNLKKLKDIECEKLSQSSNVLRAIESNPGSDWKEKLLAERILLKHGK